jgi:hypothetical protein
MMPCSVVVGHQRFGGLCCLYLQGEYSQLLLLHLTFALTYTKSCVTFRNKLFFYGEEMLAPHPTPLSAVTANAYSVNSQLPSISVGRHLYLQTENAPCNACDSGTSVGLL